MRAARARGRCRRRPRCSRSRSESTSTRFPLADGERRRSARKALGVPASAFVVGLVPEGRRRAGRRARAEAREGPGRRSSPCSSVCAGSIPELFVLLTGPARGYVRKRARRPRRPVPARRRCRRGTSLPAPTTRSTSASSRRARRAGRRPRSSRWRPASRSCTTRVGQAAELVDDGENGLLADVDDVDASARRGRRVHDDPALAAPASRTAGRPDRRGLRGGASRLSLARAPRGIRADRCG